MTEGSRRVPLRSLFVLAVFVIFSFLAGRIYLVMGDDGSYIALARSLHAGQYRAINVPDHPVQTQYPPLFPLLLYPVAGLPEGSIGVARLWVACWALLAVFPLAAVARARDPDTGYFSLLPFLVSPLFAEYSTTILTESLYVTLAYAVLARAMDATSTSTGRFDPLIPLGLVFAWLTRSSGVALVAAVVLAFFLRRQYRAGARTVLLVALGMSPWWFWQLSHQSDYIRDHIMAANIYDPSAGTYSLFDLITRRVPYNLTRYAGRVLADVIFAPWFRPISPRTTLFALKVFASVLAGAAIALGLFRRCRSRSWSVEELYVLFSAGLFLIHPVFADRYLYAILPSLIGYFLLSWSSPRHRINASIVLAALSLAGCVLALAEPIPRDDAAYMEAVEWIDEHAREDDLVLARKATAVWYYTGRVSTGYPAEPDAAIWSHPRLRYVIRDDYVIGIHAASRYLDPLLVDTSTFSLAFTSAILPEVRIYEIHRASALNP
ncbi:MAG: hypothetical protein AAB229_04770 [Candidatus Hydrogenedentota bacterium]